ncbi:P-loop containing nucleoside triphosphate hydrolase protein [Trichoderma sp. SZMC 28015]
MVDESSSQAGASAPNEEEVQAQHDTIIRRLRSGELRGRVKAVLITGHAGAGKSNLLKLISRSAIQIGYRTTNGTVDALCHFVTLENELFVFIDTPGFGTAGYSASQVKSVIQGTLGFATRYFGRVYGVLYVHSIEIGRESTGVTQSLDFLRSLKREGKLPTLIFVTTKWDRMPNEKRQLYEDRVADLENTTWEEFTDHGYIEFGCNYHDSSPEARQTARAALVEQLRRQYERGVNVSKEMRIWEWTWGEIRTGIAVVTARATGDALALAGSTLVASSTLTAAGMGYGLFLSAPFMFPLVIARIAIGMLWPESRNRELRIGIDTTGI